MSSPSPARRASTRGCWSFGLILSVLLMGVAANFIARYIDRYRWIAWVGLLVILWVALKMIYEGAGHVAPVIAPLFA